MKPATRPHPSKFASDAGPSSSAGDARPDGRRIVALFQPQEVEAGKVIDVGARLHLDVTASVLSMSARQLHGLSDNCQTTDDLVRYDMHMHNGVFRVEVCEAICAHFGVQNLRDIDERNLSVKRAEHAQWRRGVAAVAAVTTLTRRSPETFDLSRLHPSPGARVAFHP